MTPSVVVLVVTRGPKRPERAERDRGTICAAEVVDLHLVPAEQSRLRGRKTGVWLLSAEQPAAPPGWPATTMRRDSWMTRGSTRAVPSWFVETAKNAYAWHNIDAELAQLTYDSESDQDKAAVVRSENASIRALTFTSAHLSLELEVTEGSLLAQ